MARLRQEISFGPGTYRGIPFPKDRLREFVDSSNKAIKAGVPIPLLFVHAKPNASDKETEQFASKDGNGRGWVTRFFQGKDGSLGFEADNVPDDFAKQVQVGKLKTSPEFRNFYECEKAGVFSGPIVRHMAFTDKPGNPHQSDVVAFKEAVKAGCFQFSEYDKDEDEEEDDKTDNDDSELEDGEENDDSETTDVMPDDSGTDADEVDELENKFGTTDKDEDEEKEKKPEEAEQYAESKIHKLSEVELHHLNFVHDVNGPNSQATKPTHPGNVKIHDKLVKKGLLREEKLDNKVNTHVTEDGLRHINHYKKNTSQHSERTELLKSHGANGTTAQNHGYSYVGGGVFKHGNGSKIHLPINGGIHDTWIHEDNAGRTKAGYGADEMNQHLANHHGTAVTQHAEMITMSDGKTKLAANNSAVLGGRGWKEVGGPTGGHTGHQHADFPGHHILSHKDGNWTHTGPYGVLGAGKGSQSLHDHLTKHHNRDSQHAEEKTDDPAETNEPVDIVTPESPPPELTEAAPVNLDMPPPDVDKAQLTAVIAGMAQAANVILPSDWDPYTDPVLAMKVLLGCLNTSIKAKQAQEAEEVANTGEEEQPPQPVSMPFTEQFSEFELAAMAPKVRAAVEAGEKQRKADYEARQFAEQEAREAKVREAAAKAELVKNNSIAFIKSKQLPPVLANKLTSALEIMQFSEEPSLFTPTQVASMLDDALPKNFRFSPAEVIKSPLPKDVDQEQFFERDDIAPGHISDERAEKIVSESPFMKNLPKAQPISGVSSMVRNENARNPNNVMRS